MSPARQGWDPPPAVRRQLVTDQLLLETPQSALRRLSPAGPGDTGRVRRRAPRASGPGTPAGRFERLLFGFMGPPQLGDVTAPPSVPRDDAAALCPRCGLAWDAHERVRTPSRSYLTCPVPAG